MVKLQIFPHFSSLLLLSTTLTLLTNVIHDLASNSPDSDGEGRGWECLEREYKEDHIWFITVTRYSSIQEGNLVRTAQALFPFRDTLTWVLIQDVRSVLIPEDESSFDGVDEHLLTLDRLLPRFSLPYVLLSSNVYEGEKRIFLNPGTAATSDQTKEVSARQSGLAWVLEYAPKGVVIMRHEEHVYDPEIFRQIINTVGKVYSWPVGLGRPLGFSGPVVTDGIVRGYHTGQKYFHENFILDVSAFAVSLSFLRNEVETENLWKLTYDGVYDLASIGIYTDDVTALGSNGTEVLVWRAKTFVPKFPPRVKMEKWKGTNLEVVLRHLYGPRFASIISEREQP